MTRLPRLAFVITAGVIAVGAVRVATTRTHTPPQLIPATLRSAFIDAGPHRKGPTAFLDVDLDDGQRVRIVTLLQSAPPPGTRIVVEKDAAGAFTWRGTLQTTRTPSQ